MRLVHCGQCGSLVFFESVQCVHCGCTLAFSPEDMAMLALAPADDGDHALSRTWQRVPTRGSDGTAPPAHYQLCTNRTTYGACTFALPAADAQAHGGLCAACRRTRVLPDLSLPDNLRRWSQIESAKRHLFYTLARLGLLSTQQPGPVYEFLADVAGAPPVMTGHAQGVVTERNISASLAAEAVAAAVEACAGRGFRVTAAVVDRRGGCHGVHPSRVRGTELGLPLLQRIGACLFECFRRADEIVQRQLFCRRVPPL